MSAEEIKEILKFQLKILNEKLAEDLVLILKDKVKESATLSAGIDIIVEDKIFEKFGVEEEDFLQRCTDKGNKCKFFDSK